MTVKSRAILALQELPDDADFHAITEKLDFMAVVDKGLQEARDGKLLSEAQVRERLAKWLMA